MASKRHNLSRRAVLGAAAGACVAASAKGTVPGTSPHSASAAALQRRWTRTLAAYRRAEARVAAFKAEEALLPPERREWPAVQPLEERFGDLDSHRLAALRRLFRIPAPNLAALALKLDLAVAGRAWELEECEICFVKPMTHAVSPQSREASAKPPAPAIPFVERGAPSLSGTDVCGFQATQNGIKLCAHYKPTDSPSIAD
jgi:hypothetical protein